MKSCEEFSTTMDVLWNNISSNQAPGLSEYEKSVFLTKAQNELVKNYFDAGSKGNNIGKGFDESALKQMDFSTLLNSVEQSATSDDPVLDHRALVYTLPVDVLVIINEEIVLKGGIQETTKSSYYTWNGAFWEGSASVDTSATIKGEITSVGLLPKTDLTAGDVYQVNTTINSSSVLGILQVIPVSYGEYVRLMSKPFKEPLKWQAWRLMTQGSLEEGVPSNKVEIVISSSDKLKYPIRNYVLRYVRKPRPIVLTDLSEYGEDIKIEGIQKQTMCELPEGTHDAILQRAVELAKIAWNGDSNETQLQMTSGQRSE